MLRRALNSILIFGAIVFATGLSDARPVSDLLDLPPAFRALFGDPEVVVKPSASSETSVRFSGVGEYSPFFGIRKSLLPPRVVVRTGRDCLEIGAVIAEAMSRRFYGEMLDSSSLSRYERRLEMGELIELSEDRFISLSKRMLMGQSAESEVLEDWWTVRMGLSRTPDRDHALLVTVIHTDRGSEPGKESMGHLSLGLRHRRGQSDRDFIIDFRAPWYLDRPPRPLEGFNFRNTLRLAGFTENLYDWLHTQTAYRGCYVKIWMLPIAREQTTLLRHFDQNVGVHKAGNFRALRKNCASLAFLFFDRLQPIHEPLPASPSIADLPLPGGLRIVSGYGDVPFYEIENVTEELGREPTAKSEIHRAVPTRDTSRVFRALAVRAESN